MRMLTRLVLSAAAVALLGGTPLDRADEGDRGERSDNSPHVGAELLQAPAGSVLRRGHRHRHEFERARLRLSPQRRYPAVRVRSERHLRQGMGRRRLRHRVRAPGARRSAGQRLGRRRGDEHGHQVQPRRARRDGARPQAGACRRRDTDSERAEPAGARSRSTDSAGRPTSTWDAQGNIFVSDGYVNSRVVKYDKNGRFIAQFAGGARATVPNQLNTPHSITSDAQGNIYVGDRGNRRIVVLNNDLTLKTQYTNVGNPWAVCISPGPHQYLYSSNSNPDCNAGSVVGRSPARSTRWSSTARSSASSARPAKGSASSAPSTRSTAATPISCSCRRSPRGARRRSS